MAQTFLSFFIFSCNWVFLLNITLDTVALISSDKDSNLSVAQANFVKNFNFCGGLFSQQSSGQTFEHSVLQQ